MCPSVCPIWKGTKMSMDSIKWGSSAKGDNGSDDSNYFYCHLLKANNNNKTPVLTITVSMELHRR